MFNNKLYVAAAYTLGRSLLNESFVLNEKKYSFIYFCKNNEVAKFVYVEDIRYLVARYVPLLLFFLVTLEHNLCLLYGVR